MKKDKRKTGIARLIQIAGAKRWLLIVSMIFSLISSILQFIPIIAIFNILLALAKHTQDLSAIDKSYIWQWSYIALGSFILWGIFYFATLVLSHIIAFNILYKTRIQLLKKIAYLPLGFFTKRASGGIKKVLSEDVERLELFIAHHIIDVVTAVVFPILLITYMFWVDWRLALVIMVVLLFALIGMMKMSSSKKSRYYYEKYTEVLGRMNASIIEYVRGIMVVKTFTESSDAYKRLSQDIQDYREFSNEMNVVYQPVYVSFLTILSSALLFIIPLGTYLLLKSDSYMAYIPVVLMFLLFSITVFFPVFKLLWIGGFMQQNIMGVKKIDDILYAEEIEDLAVTREPKDASIEFRNVYFAYDKDDVLKDISFKATPGSVTALVGPSGSGKSTIAMLTARFWDIQRGEILIGGVPIKEISTENLMENIAFVFQDNILFFDTIEENIRMGNKTATIEQVQAAARAAQCSDFIEKLPNGYQTLVGEGGTYLSGGEQQRIALARAILKDAPIILLDEATAFADPENESKILKAFAHLIEGKTVLIIAHRLSTVINADCIHYIDKGAILETGTHEELIEKNGAYKYTWDIYNQTKDWSISVRE